MDNSIDVYLRTMSVYGAIANGLTEQTSQSLVVESGVGGLQVTDWSGGGAGLHGLVIRNTVNPGAGVPTWLNFYNFVSDCSAGGDGWLFDSSLGANQIGATFVDSWSAGAGQDCSQTTMTDANAVGVHISGGSGIHIVGGGKIRANASHGVLIDGAGLKDIEIADNQFTANGFAADFQTSRGYSLLNSYIRPQTNNAGSYLYKLTSAGTSGASAPAWCQTLNCATSTGTTTWQNIGTAAEADGIYVPNYVVQLNIHDNKVGNTPESGGILQWGVRVDRDDPGSLIHDNTVNDTAQGAVKTPAGILSYLAVHDNANAAVNQVTQQFSIGPLSWKLPTGSSQGPSVIPNTTGSGSYIMGFGNNVSWNGTNFTTLTDTASNGASLMGMNYGSGTFSFYVVPTNTPSSGQTIPPSSMSSYLRATIDSNGINGTLGATTPFNATVNNLTVNGNCTGCGSGGTVNLGAPPAIGNVTPNAGNFTTLRASDTAATLFPEIDVRALGAVGDGQIAGPGCAMAAGSHTLTCTSGTFAAVDVGKAIWVEGAGAATGCGLHVTCPLLSTISGYSSSATVTVTAAATTAIASGYIEWGTDNTAAIQAAVDLAIAPSALQHAVYFPHVLGQANNRFGCYAITGTIQLPESTVSRNKFVTLHGDGNLASAICELRLGTPIITDTFLHQAGTGTIVRGLGFVGPPDYADVMGSAIECNYCIFIQVEHNWFTGWTNSINMDVQGAGSVTGGELIYTFNVCEESITCIRWHGTGANPGTTLVATHNTFDQMYNGSGFVLDLQYVTGIQEGYNTYGPNIGLGIKCDHCSSFNFGNDDFSQQAWGITSQNVYLSNSSNGVVHGNTFHAVATEAVDLAGGNSSILFEGNTFGYVGATARPYMAWTAGNGPNTGITVSNETIDSCASPCINVASGAMSNSAISRNYFAASIATPITVTGGVPAGSCVATGSHDVCAPGSISAQTLSASGAVTVGGELERARHCRA